MSLPWYPFKWADYISKTYHLSQGQHGAYLLLLCYIYNNAKSIPCKQCYDIAKAMTEQERGNVDFVLAAFFQQEGDFYINMTARETMEEARNKHQRRVHAGAKGGNTRASNATAMLKQPQPQLDKKESKGEILALRLAALKEPSMIMEFTAYAQQHGIKCDILLELERFTQYCLCGKGRYTNHKAAFRNWLLKRKESKYEASISGNAGGDRPNKTDRLKAAARRAAESGGFASGQRSEEGINGDAIPVLPVP